MSLENGSIDYADPQYDKLFEEFLQQEEDVILTSTGRDLTGLHKEVSADKETYTAQDEQYYHIGKTEVSRGDLDDIQKAIDTKESITSARITIHGGADELFMSELKGQQVLDAEIAKLQSLKASFSGSNRAMIEQLIAELTDQTNHKNLAAKYPRKDKRSNLGNARLIAARIASGYHEVLTDIYSSLQKSGSHDTVLSYTVDWSKCVIGANGDQWNQRKIHVAISIDTKMDEELQEFQDGDVDLELPVDLDGDGNVDLEHPVEPEPIVVEDPIDGNPLIDQAPEVIDIEACKAELIKSYGLIRMVQGLRYSFASSPKFIVHGSDREVLQVKDKVSGDVVLELGLYTDGPNKGLALVGLGDDIYEVQERGTVLDYSNLAKDHVFDSIVSDLKRRKQNIPVSANQPPEEVPVANVEFYSGEKEIIINFANSTGDVVTAAGHPELFDQDSQGNYFPNIVKIQAYYDTQGLDVEFVVPSQTYENGATLTDFALDNGKFVGEYQDLEQLKQEKKGLLITYPDGRMEFTHTDEIQSWIKIPDGVDIAMLGSVKRPGKDINENLLGTSSPNRFLVQKQDGSVEILVLYGSKEEQKKTLSQSKYARILYLDVKGNRGQIDGYWAMLNNKLTYGNHELGDVLRDKKVPIQVVSGNMPSLLIMTKPKDKKEQVDSEVIRPKENVYDGVLQLDVDNYRKFLEEMIAPGTGVTLEAFVDAVNSIPDQSIKKKVITKLQVLYDPSAAQELVGIPKSAQRSDGKIDAQALDAFRSPNSFVYKSLDGNESGLIHGSREWLASKLDNKLDGISFEKFADFLDGRSISVSYTNPYNKQPFTINAQISGIDNFVLRNKILSYIDRGDIRGMYENVYGMHDNNAINSYLHYRPIDKITPMMMHAMSLRLWYDHGTVDSKEQLDRLKMPADVRTVWKDYKKLGLHLLYPNNGPNNFAIVSKTDFKIYLFLPDGTLVGSQPILVGKNKSDSQWLVSNTPAGKYKTNGIYRSPIYNAKYYDKGLGNFIKLWSLEDRFKAIQKTDTGIGIHELYDPENRASSLFADVVSTPSARDRKRVSDGCINASNNPVDFGAIFTHLIPKSDIATCVYVTSTPNDNVVSDYYHMVQGESPLSMK